MQQPKPETVTLNDVLITEELLQRSRSVSEGESPRASNLQAENQAMRSLVQQMVNTPEIMLQSLVDMAVDLCQAGTAGVSLLETTPDGEEIFRWTVLAGALAQYVGGTTPRDFSPCGTCLDRGTPQLYAHPERYFTYFQAANTPFVEGLVLPLIADHHALGTIWIISHSEQRHFDSEDVRIMTSLADFTAAALLLSQRQTQELLVKNAQLEAEVAERKQVEAQLRDVQKRLELSLTGANLGAWTYNVGTDEFWADDRAKHMHGHEAHEVHTFAEAGVNIHPEDRDRAEAFAEAIRTRSKLQIEYRVIWRDGSIHWVASCAEFMPTGAQDDGIFYGIVQDISARLQLEGERKRAEAALRESQARLRGLIENLPGGAAFVVDRDLRYLLAEGEALLSAGFQPEDFVGRTIFEALPPELAANYEVLYRRALSGEPFEHEHDAHDRSFISRGIPLCSETGGVDAVLAVSYDISDRKRAETALRESEARLAFLLRVSDVLRSIADPVDIQETVTRTAMNYFGADRCYYCEIEDGNAIIWRDAAREDLPSVAGVYPLSRFAIFQAVVDAGRPFIVQDVHTTDIVDEELRRLCIQLQVISFVDVPVIKNGTPVGILCLVQSMPRDWTDLEVELAVETADRTWAAVERARAEAAVRESERRLRATQNNVGVGIHELDERGRYLLINETFTRMCGYTIENFADRSIFDGIPDEGDREAARDRYQRLIRGAIDSYVEEQTYVTKDGHRAWVEVQTTAVRDDEGRFLYAVRAIHDVTQRKNAEEALRESEARLEIELADTQHLQIISSQLIREDDVNALYKQILDAAVALMRSEMGSLQMFHPERNELQVLAWKGFHPESAAFWEWVSVDAKSTCGEALNGGERVIVPDVETCNFMAGTENLDFYRLSGVRAVQSTPLVSRSGNTVGMISTHWRDVHQPSKRELRLLDVLARQAADLIERRRVQAALRESEERFRAVANLVPDLLWDSEPDGSINWYNQRWIEYTGQTFEQAISWGWTDTIHPDDRAASARRYQETVKTGKPLRQEHRIRRYDGEYRWFVVNAFPLKDESGQVVKMYSAATDIHDQRTALEAVRESEARLQRAISVEAVGVMFFRLDGRITEANEALARMSGYSRDELLNIRNFQVLTDPKFLEITARSVENLATRGETPPYEKQFICKDGSHWWGLFAPTRLSGEGRTSECVEFIIDITDRKLAEADRIQLIREQANRLEAERLNQMKDEFLAMISHELQSPMVAILGWTRLLRANLPAPATLMKHLETIERNATLQAKLIQDLLDISRITAGKLRLLLQSVDLESVIEAAIATVAQTAQAKGVNLVWRATPSANENPDFIIIGDRDRLQQVVCNLLTNAIKFTPTAGSVTIELSLTKSKNSNGNSFAEIRIIDTGIGISAAFLPHIFDRFRQAEKSGSAGGLGLGLAIAHYLIELHNGTIEAQSAGVGQGATFIIRLPLVG